ncbi:hypothetical protein ASD11_16035 [Aeromicrobium sp. Root495]|uniref:FAD-dependent oxidoreductase n=1 Tax=Aeromicrobium sp. Root495 TaxID=1736550 RepID=UPI0006F315B5|nr:FAD-dependent oxidoreductase [Aeromicrobium sp. Root495]KQY55988.1 hypothetical protein ASD11_16035 [Aeromicrobium sp. Root495]
MPHVVTQSCCADASCAHACPVNCIHPTPDEPDFGLSDMVYVDPSSCVDCGACVTACPVGAISAHTRLLPGELPFIELNAAYHREASGPRPLQAPVPSIPRLERAGRASVVVVGAGPAALYTAAELVKNEQVDVTVLERLDVPHGLARFGISPDHTRTRRIRGQLDRILDHPRVTLRTGVEVGRDVSLDDLRAEHHAVVLATGATLPRRLAVPGADLPQVTTAFELVTWWNGHPEAVRPVLESERAVVVGAGNVALDVARMLTASPEVLRRAELSSTARQVLAESSVRHVDVVARGTAMDAAFTTPELVGLVALEHVVVRVDGLEERPAGLTGLAEQRWNLLAQLAARPEGGERTITLRFGQTPVEVVGDGRVAGVRVRAADDTVRALPAGLVVAAIGQVAHEPVEHSAGRVLAPESGTAEPGLYCVGWLKRGGRGFIGSNRACARETTRSVLDDVNALARTVA